MASIEKMTVHVTVGEAATHLPNLIRQSLLGEEIIIDLDENGTEQVEIIASKHLQNEAPKERVAGIDEGNLIVPEDLNDPLSTDSAIFSQNPLVTTNLQMRNKPEQIDQE